MFRATSLTRYLTRQHPQAEQVVGQIIAAPRRADVVAATFDLGALAGFFVTYGIIANWIYQGHLDLWDGVYGIEDDDEDDD